MLSKEDILRGLAHIDARAREAGQIVDLAVYGGAALVLAFDLRHATRDVDAVVHGSPDFVRQVVREVASEEGWPADWLNDAVKGFLSSLGELRALGGFQAGPEGGLRVYTPTPAYLFAMKCMAMRPEGVDGSRDISDIRALARLAGIARTEDAINLVASFYPENRIAPKVRFGIEEILGDSAPEPARRPRAPGPGPG